MKHFGWLVPSLVALGGCAALGGASPRLAPRVDYHQHLVSPAFQPIAKVPEMDGRSVIAMMDAAGVEKAVVLSMGYSFADERKNVPDPDAATRRENDWTSEQAAASGGRLIGFCGVNPLRPEALGEIERCLKLPGMRGLKLHLGNSGVSLRDPVHAARIGDAVSVAERLRAPVLVHMRARGGANYGAEDARLFLEKVTPRAPRTEIIVAHLGASGPGFTDQHEEVLAVFAAAAERRDPRMRNVYFDMSGILTPKSTAEEGARVARSIRRLGAGRFLYGSDRLAAGSPTIGADWALYTTLLNLTEGERRTIANNRLRFTR